MFDVRLLPAFNAICNFSSFIFLCLAFYFVKKKKIELHKKFIFISLFFSSCFLTSYLYYHFTVPAQKFAGTGFWKTFYLFILFPHIVLAALMLPLIFMTLYRAIKKDWVKHKKIAKWTFPIWIYVSITGVMIYIMLYQMNF